MSSMGSQWRVIRHYLSISNLNAEVEKLLQRVKPASAEQWDNLIKRFEKAISTRITSTTEIEKKHNDAKLKATTVEETNPKAVTKEEIDSRTKDVIDSRTKDVPAPSTASTPSTSSVGSDYKELTFESLWQGLRLKKDIQMGKISEPTWKDQKPTVTKSSIHSRTAYVISAVVAAESKESVLARAERLVEHLHAYPEARDYAIKEGAVRALLRVEHDLEPHAPLSKEISGVVKEALALVGYTRPPLGPGANILSLDGGGIRGIIAIEILRHLERLTGKRVQQLFDYIVGVSTGAIIAAVIARGGPAALDTARHMYYTLSREMFGNTSLLGGGARLVWTHAYYDTQAWERMLRDNLGDATLTQCNRIDAPKLGVVSCVVNPGSRLSPFLFRSYSAGWRVRSVFPGTSRALLWHAVRASAAAPTYFDEFRLDGLLHQDGGIMVNNPTGVGLHEAKLLFGSDAVRRGTVVSVGTGRALASHTDYQLMTRALQAQGSPQSTSWKDKFNKILDSATDTEGVHLVLNDLLPAGNYYRFNPPLMQECAMDEINTEKLDNLVVDTQAYIRRNQHKFSQAAEQLTRPRSLPQKVMDIATHRAHLAGIIAHY